MGANFRGECVNKRFVYWRRSGELAEHEGKNQEGRAGVVRGAGRRVRELWVQPRLRVQDVSYELGAHVVEEGHRVIVRHCTGAPETDVDFCVWSDKPIFQRIS